MLLKRRRQGVLGDFELSLKRFSLLSEGAFGLLDLQVGLILTKRLSTSLSAAPPSEATGCWPFNSLR